MQLWDSIEEMPVYNWFKIHATGNLTFLRVEPLREFEHSDYFNGIWHSLYDEFLDKYGLSDEFQQLMKLKKRHTNELLDYIINGDNFKLTEAELTEVEISEIMNQQNPLEDDETIIMIEESLGFKIDTKAISVVDYYNYLKFIGNKAKKQAKNGR